MLFFSSVLTAAVPKPGDVIDSSNVAQYTYYFPAFMVGFIKNGNDMTESSPIHVGDIKTPLPPESFRKASEKNIGKVTINPDDLSLTGFDFCGYPFPEVKEPHKSEKIIVNYYYKWRPADYYYDDKRIITSASQRKGGRIVRSTSKAACIVFVGRTAPGFQKNLDNPNGLYWAQFNHYMQLAFKDLKTLQWRYLDTKKDDDLWSYIPTLRRTLRMLSSEKANPINGTPLTYDDFFGFDGKLSQFTYKIIAEKTMLGNIAMDEEVLYKKHPDGYYDYPVFHGPDFPYGIADTYVVEVKPKDPRYPESKKVIYMNKINYQNMYSEIFDRNGELWKGLQMNVVKKKTTPGEDSYFSSQSDIDFKTGYWIQINGAANVQDNGLPADALTPGMFYTW